MLIQCTGQKNREDKKADAGKIEEKKGSVVEAMPQQEKNRNIELTGETELASFLRFANKEVLIDEIGTDNVSTKVAWFEEGTVKKEFSTLYGGTDDEVTITWDTEGPIVETSSKSGRWQARGIKPGTSLAELVKMNNAPIEFYGFGWDYGGTVKLGNGDIKDDGLKLVLNITDESFNGKLLGDKLFSSADLEAGVIDAIEVVSVGVTGLDPEHLAEWNNADENSLVNPYPTQELNKDQCKQFDVTGDIIKSLSWKDKSGENVMIFSLKCDVEEMEEGPCSVSLEIIASHYLKKEGDWKLIQSISDAQRDCMFENNAGFSTNAISVTDVNQDGFAEITFGYILGCTSEASPNFIKLIMLDKEKEYDITGTLLVTAYEEPWGGETKISADFNSAPKGFLVHAKQIWKRCQEDPYNTFPDSFQ
ncbi:hypothetical protein DMA11_19495 [Marinilabiliaceae bacterium JC017]|nr:hypothetical protein DMA11_19495 [Marinilabiliaceae bacterium JC017]